MNPQQPFQPPVTPQWPGAGPYPASARPASGGTGVVGGLLAVVAGLALLTGLIWRLVDMGRIASVAISIFEFQLAIALQGLAIVLLLAGGALLCLRVGAGRFLIPAGAALLLVQLVVTLVEVSAFILPIVVFHAARVQDVAMLAILLALAGSLFGLLPSTARWVSTLRT
ncbi:hypothetical protein [Lentzea sp. E54]|uniref:hypothetical protein n=1 Tax=Lentzea xerophila TaxID=3435883 RepID=UPI003DA4F2A7